MRFEQADLFGGHGRVQIDDLLQQKSLPPFREVLQCQLEPGGTVGAHRQEHFSEILLVAEGQGQAVVGGQPQVLGPGSLVLLPLGQILELRNTHAQNWLCYFIVKAG